MPGYGPPPKEQKRRRNADTYGGTRTVTDDGERLGPELTGLNWSPAARAYYETWQRSPQAKLFLDTDWMRLRMLIPLVERYLDCADTKMLAEIRQNESLLGATTTDRLRARIKVERPSEGSGEAAAGVTALDEYRRTLAG